MGFVKSNMTKAHPVLFYMKSFFRLALPINGIRQKSVHRGFPPLHFFCTFYGQIRNLSQPKLTTIRFRLISQMKVNTSFGFRFLRLRIGNKTLFLNLISQKRR